MARLGKPVVVIVYGRKFPHARIIEQLLRKHRFRIFDCEFGHDPMGRTVKGKQAHKLTGRDIAIQIDVMNSPNAANKLKCFLDIVLAGPALLGVRCYSGQHRSQTIVEIADNWTSAGGVNLPFRVFRISEEAKWDVHHAQD